MKVITPQELREGKIPDSETRIADARRIIDEFNRAMSTNNFHYLSTEKNKYIYYPHNGDYCKKDAFDLAAAEIKKAGWDIDYGMSSCAHGTFNSIIVHL